MNLILRDISLPLATFELELSLKITGPVTVLFGPSGAGKTSLLELIAGLRSARSAFIQIDELLLTDTSNGVSVPTRRRRIGYVPQDLALFPHLSVRQNLLYGHRGAMGGHETYDSVVDLLEIRPLVNRGIAQLSGGEKQRVALGRALLASPKLLLLDEPLANLDLQLRRKIIPYLARIRDQFRIPILYVTHDHYEVLSLADEIIVLVDGKVAQAGSVQEVFRRPATLDVAGLVTIETILPGRIVAVTEGLATVEVGDSRLNALDPDLPSRQAKVHVCIRAEDVILSRNPDQPTSARNQLHATIKSIAHEGFLRRVELDCGFPLAALITRQACEELGVNPGEPVVALVKASSVHLIPR